MSIIPFSIRSRIKKVFGIICLIAGGVVIGYALAHAQTRAADFADTRGSGPSTVTLTSVVTMPVQIFSGTGAACEIKNGRVYFIVPSSTERIDIGAAANPLPICGDPRPSAATPSLLPNPQLTPGVIRISDAATVCRVKWGADRRHVTARMKREVCSSYGIAPADCTGKNYEIDHLIPRELGGADDVRNLWPQPWPQARLKDKLENELHRMVCATPGSGVIGIPLKTAQEAMATNWYEIYLRGFGK